MDQSHEGKEEGIEKNRKKNRQGKERIWCAAGQRDAVYYGNRGGRAAGQDSGDTSFVIRSQAGQSRGIHSAFASTVLRI